MEAKQVTSYRLWVTGLFGRNRKAKKEMFDLGETPRTAQMDEAALLKAVQTKAAELKVKPGAKFLVVACDETIEPPVNYADGVTITSRTFGVFDNRRVFTGSMGTAGVEVFVPPPKDATYPRTEVLDNGMVRTYHSAICYQDRPPKPVACPTCGGSESELIHTVTLGWECRACRAYRQEHHSDPSQRLKSVVAAG